MPAVIVALTNKKQSWKGYIPQLDLCVNTLERNEQASG